MPLLPNPPLTDEQAVLFIQRIKVYRRVQKGSPGHHYAGGNSYEPIYDRLPAQYEYTENWDDPNGPAGGLKRANQMTRDLIFVPRGVKMVSGDHTVDVTSQEDLPGYENAGTVHEIRGVGKFVPLFGCRSYAGMEVEHPPEGVTP